MDPKRPQDNYGYYKKDNITREKEKLEYPMEETTHNPQLI